MFIVVFYDSKIATNFLKLSKCTFVCTVYFLILEIKINYYIYAIGMLKFFFKNIIGTLKQVNSRGKCSFVPKDTGIKIKSHSVAN